VGRRCPWGKKIGKNEFERGGLKATTKVDSGKRGEKNPLKRGNSRRLWKHQRKTQIASRGTFSTEKSVRKKEIQRDREFDFIRAL